MENLSNDADTLESIASAVDAGVRPGAYGSALRSIAARLRASAPADAAPATDAAPASDTGAPTDAIAAMAASCEDCRAQATGDAPAHNSDMLRHQLSGHADALARLLADALASGATVYLAGA